MIAEISSLNGRKLNNSSTITVPASKSHTIRALLIASAASGESRLISPLDSADTRSCINACRSLGAVINTENSSPDGTPIWTVDGCGGKFPETINEIDVGNSGTSLYLAAGLASLAENSVSFTGDEQIKNRPVKPLLDSLSELGADVKITGKNGCPPFTLKGPLKGGKTSIECPTSQYLSALLIASPLAAGTSRIEVPLLMEKPYVEMTLRWLEEQKINLHNDNLRRFTINGGQKYTAFESVIPGDFSSAAFPLCAAAITASTLRLAGLDISDSQGDKAIIDYLRKMGCVIEVKDRLITITGTEQLKAADFDLNDTPDALPAMAVTACFARGTTRLYNVAQARLKETDRISVMATELGKLGAEVEELEDGLIIHGRGNDDSPLSGTALNGHGDHRVVMSLAVAALAASGTSTISDAEAVEITYPGFFKFIDSVSRS